MYEKKSIPTLIVLGSGEWEYIPHRYMYVYIYLFPFWSSGGHTNEMFRLLSGTDLNIYKPRHYTIASTDTMSAKKMEEFEKNVRVFRRCFSSLKKYKSFWYLFRI